MYILKTDIKNVSNNDDLCCISMFYSDLHAFDISHCIT